MTSTAIGCVPLSAVCLVKSDARAISLGMTVYYELL